MNKPQDSGQIFHLHGIAKLESRKWMSFARKAINHQRKPKLGKALKALERTNPLNLSNLWNPAIFRLFIAVAIISDYSFRQWQWKESWQ